MAAQRYGEREGITQIQLQGWIFHSAGGGKQKPRPKGNPGEPDEETSRQSYSQDKFLQSQILLQVLVRQWLLQNSLAVGEKKTFNFSLWLEELWLNTILKEILLFK